MPERTFENGQGYVLPGDKLGTIRTRPGVVMPGDELQMLGGADYVNQEGRIVVKKREYARENGLKNYTFKRTEGMNVIVYTDGEYKEIKRANICARDYMSHFLRRGADLVHVIEVSDSDQTIVSPITIWADGAIPVYGIVSMTFNFRLNNDTDAHFYENLLNSDFKKTVYGNNETVVEMNGSNLRLFFHHHLQNAIRDPVSHETVMFNKIPEIRERFMYSLTHEPVFRHLNLVSADLRFALNDYENFVGEETRAKMQIERDTLNSGVRVAKIKLAIKEYSELDEVKKNGRNSSD